jgi:hypothetical protein
VPSLVGEDRGGDPKSLPRSAPECRAVLVGGLVVERGRVRLSKVEETVADRVEHELQVAVALLRAVSVCLVPRRLRIAGLAQKRGLVGGKQVELPLDEIAEPPLSAQDQTTSR